MGMDDRRGHYTDDGSRAMSENRGQLPGPESRRIEKGPRSVLEHGTLPSRSRVDDLLQLADECQRTSRMLEHAIQRELENSKGTLSHNLKTDPELVGEQLMQPDDQDLGAVGPPVNRSEKLKEVLSLMRFEVEQE